MDAFHAFPDLNVLLHFPAFDGLDWCALCDCDRVVIHLTQPLLSELNKVKGTGHAKAVRQRAATIQHRLRALLKSDGVKAELNNKVTVVLEGQSPRLDAYPSLNPSVADDLLIAAILSFVRESAQRAALITDDSGLALMVKAANWNIQVLEPPAALRLPPEPDADTKEKEELRRRLSTFENALPVPVLTFSDETKLFRIKIADDDIEFAVGRVVRKQKEKHPRLGNPKNPKPIRGMSLGQLAALGGSHTEALLNDPEEVQSYNDQLEEYFAEFEQVTRGNLRLRRRLVSLQLQITNDGAAPAMDVLADMHFPNALKVFDKARSKKIFHGVPDPPLLPGHFRDLRGSFTSMMPNLSFPGPIDPTAPSLFIRETNSYEVQWRVPKLRQGYLSKIDPILVLFDAEPFSFSIEYSIVADNLPETVTGKLSVVAEPSEVSSSP